MKAVFLVGAGFNVDTRSEAPRVYGQHRLECEYPLLSDLSRICFDVASVDPAKSIEEMLAEAQLRGETEPLTRLANKIMSADYWIGKELTREGALNIYSKFFDRFDSSDFITFNYDSLIEIFLYHRNHWCPDDGYGVTVVTSDSDRPVERPGSTSLVLHLHGTFCLYMSDHEFIDRTGEGTAWYETLDPPRYNFDPYRIAKRFRPYRGTAPTSGYEPVAQRVVAPVPDKAEGLLQKFVQEMYKRAQELVESSGVLISIGYGFGAADEASYMPLLRTLERCENARLVIIDPLARQISERLVPNLIRTRVSPLDFTLKEWAERGFPMDRP